MKIFSLGLASVVLAATSAFGVDLSTLLANPGFEKGLQVLQPGDYAACPIGWTCSGSPTPGATSYSPTAPEFTAGSDGLGTNLLTPGGVSAALCPTLIEGSCVLSQTGLGTYAAGTTYTLNLWVGTPKTMPFDQFGHVDDKSATIPAQRVTFYWTGNGVAGGFPAKDITPPAPGQWILVPLSFTPTGAQVGQAIGIQIYASSSNYSPVVFDIAPPCTC